MKKLLFLSLIVFVLGACTDAINDYNTDTKNPETVPSSALVGNSIVSLFDFMSEPNVNVNNFRLYAQHWAQTTYPDESNYELIERSINARGFNTMYSTVLKDIKEARPIIDADVILTADQKAAQNAILDVLEVFSYTFLVDVFGDVPFSEALTDELTPVYDDAETIYNALFDQLDGAIAALGTDSHLEGDLIYGGSSAAWKKAANTLKLRMAIRIADKNAAKAKSAAESAVASGVFESSADDFKLNYEGSTPNTNPLWEQLVQSGRSDFVCSHSFAYALNLLGDPRIPYFFKNNGPDGEAVGGLYGTANSYPANSQPGTMLEDPTLPGNLMSFTEVAFLLADASERGFNVGGSAAEWYNAGVTNSIMEWGGTAEEATAYLANPLVDYGSAPGTWKQKVATQKWIAMYNMGFEAWTTYRMYDWPELPPAADSQRPVIKRYTYPVTEGSLNADEMNAAIAKMGGSDDIQNKIFWDVN